MALKFSRAAWFLSILTALAALLFAYASLPEDVIVFQEGSEFIYTGKEMFFYSSLLIIALINSMVFLVSALYKSNEPLRTWFNGQMSVLNLFFIISLLLINAINSNEKFNFERIGFIIYGSVILIALWALSWPVYLIIRKFSNKASV
jgi:hypothetical protein